MNGKALSVDGTCLSEDVIAKILAGEELVGEQEIQTGQHLETCRRCRDVLDQRLTDALIGMPERPPELEACDEEKVDALVQKLMDSERRGELQLHDKAIREHLEHGNGHYLFGDFELIRHLKSGGMGSVYEARDRTLGRRCAVKLINSGIYATNSEIQRFLREANAAAVLDHPSIVKVWRVGEHRDAANIDRHYVVMELVSGESLETKIEAKKKISERQIAIWVKQVAEGLAHAHGDPLTLPSPPKTGARELFSSTSKPGEREQVSPSDSLGQLDLLERGAEGSSNGQSGRARVVHRDIKPSNILIDLAGNAKIIDFGLAKIEGVGQAITRYDTLLGTTAYMSPEQTSGGFDKVGSSSDIFSLGVVLYELLTGQRPFVGKTAIETYNLICKHEPTAPRKLDRTIALDLETICLKCLEKEPKQRYPTATELANDLGAFLEGREIKARPNSQFEKTMRWCRRNRQLATALAAIGLMVFSGVAIIVSIVVWNNVLFRIQNKALAESKGKVDATNKSLEAINKNNEQLIGEKSAQVVMNERLKRESDTRLAASVLKRAQDSIAEGRTGEAKGLLAGSVGLVEPTWETRHLKLSAEKEPKWTHRQAIGLFEILACAVDPTEKRVAVSDSHGNLVVMSAEDLRIEKKYGTTRIREYKGKEFEDMPFLVPTVWHFLRNRDDAPMQTWPENCFTSMVWLADSKTIIAASLNGSLVSIDTELDTQKELAKFSEPLSALRLHPAGKYLLTGSRDGTLWRVDLAGKIEFESKRPGAPVSTILWSKASGCWFVGLESGGVLSCNELLEDWKDHFRASRIVWELAEVNVDSRQLIAVAANNDRIAMFNPTTNIAVSGIEWISLPQYDSKITDAFTVRQSRDGKLLFAADNAGRLNVIDIAQRKARYSPMVHSSSGHASGVADGLAKQSPPRQLLGRMNARVSFVEPIGENRCLTGGQNATIFSLRLPSETSAVAIRTLQSATGTKPELAFDETDVNRLWALDESGKLTLIDVNMDVVLDSVKAHDGGAAGIVSTVDGIVATVGGDRFVKFWGTNGSKITTADRPAFELDVPMISIAFSRAAGMLAGVDEQAQLRLWNFESGQQIDLPTSDSAERPLTGRVAFNLDGSLLVAGGASQEVIFVNTKKLERISVRTDIAGQGLMAAAWSGRDPDVVLLADHRLGNEGVLNLVDIDPTTENWINNSELLGGGDRWAIAKTSDGRIAVLEFNGALSFFDAENFVRTFDLQLQGGGFCSLAFDRNDRRLVVATKAGALTALDSLLPNNIALPVENDVLAGQLELFDSRADWTESQLVGPEKDRFICPFAIAFNPKSNKFAVGTIHGRASQGWPEILIETDDGMISESPKTGNDTSDANVRSDSLSLQWRDDGALCGWWYGWISAEAMYTGNLVYAVRNAPNDWAIDQVAQMNAGFYPVIFQPDGDKPLEIWHHNMGELFTLVRSSFDAENGWTSAGIGKAGDGLALRGTADANGNRYLSWVSHRFNGDQAPNTIGVWDGVELKRIQVSENLGVHGMAIGPSGQLVIFTTDYSTELGENSVGFWHLEDSNWKKVCDAPPVIADSSATGKFGFDADGNLAIAHTDASGSDILLSTFANGHWSTDLVSSLSANDQVSKCDLYFDSAHQPMIAVYHTGPNAWCNVLRKKEIVSN